MSDPVLAALIAATAVCAPPPVRALTHWFRRRVEWKRMHERNVDKMLDETWSYGINMTRDGADAELKRLYREAE